MHLRQYTCWSLRCSWSIACRRCSNYIFILDLDLASMDWTKTTVRRDKNLCKFCNLVRLLLEILRYSFVQHDRELMYRCAKLEYRKISNIRHTLVGNKIIDHSDVVGASPVGAAPTTSSFSTWHLALRDSAKTATRQYKNLLSVGIWCVSRLYGISIASNPSHIYSTRKKAVTANSPTMLCDWQLSCQMQTRNPARASYRLKRCRIMGIGSLHDQPKTAW